MPSPEGFAPSNQMLDTGDTASVWTPAVWRNVPVDNIRSGKKDGVLIETFFNRGFKPSANVNAAEAYWENGWMAFGSDGGSIAQTVEAGMTGGTKIAADGDNEGLVLRTQASPFKLNRANKSFAYEAVVEFTTIADTTFNAFVGLMGNTAATVDIPIADNAALADVNLFGFHRLQTDGDKLDLVYKADGVTAVTVLADAVTVVAATELRLGLTYDQQPDFDKTGRYWVRAWKDGRVIASGTKQIPSTDGDDFPNDVGLCLVFAIRNAAGSSPGNMEIKRVRAAQCL